MGEDEFGRLIYLILLGGVIAGYFFLQNRNRLGQLAQQAAIWGFIFIGVVVAYGLWDDITRSVAPRQAIFDGTRIEVPRARDGHYYLTAEINGVAVEFVVDTGATDVVLTRQDAVAAGIDLDELRFYGTANTANGVVRTAQVRLDSFRLGDLEDTRLVAWVNEGEMDGSLLGMAYLQRFRRIEIERDRLILTR